MIKVKEETNYLISIDQESLMIINDLIHRAFRGGSNLSEFVNASALREFIKAMENRG